MQRIAVAVVWLLMAALWAAEPRDEAVDGQPASQERRHPLERSYWVHASLGSLTQRGYFGPHFPATTAPVREEVFNAARMLGESYAANRLYLIYHKEMDIGEARQVFAWWREACPPTVEIVPTLVLRMYDEDATPVFTVDEIAELAAFFRARINPERAAVYDIAANRDQGEALAALAKHYKVGLIRVGLQPGEAIGPPFAAAVADTWSGFCHGRRNEQDWLQPGFGAATLRGWVEARNDATVPIAWNLIVVAWDYEPTERGGYPGYDDADLNMPLPSGRNYLGAALIRQHTAPAVFAGYSSDLYILHENSRSAKHDGAANSFYACLKEGRAYRGYYAEPLDEIIAIYRDLADE